MPKKKGNNGGNSNSVQTQEFLENRFSPAQKRSKKMRLAKTALCVKLPLDIDAILRPMPNRSEWMRRVICDAARAELMGSSTRPPVGSHKKAPLYSGEDDRRCQV